MEFPYYSAALGAFLLMLQQLFMISVGFHRVNVKLGVGIGEDPQLERKVRRHGNLAENAGIFIVVLALTELSGASTSVVSGFAIAFAIGRICHALGFMHLDGSHVNLEEGNKVFIGLRVVGATLTGWVGLGLGGYLAYTLLSA
ncbi:MAG: MAPEG family protein [Halioglobus sp.]